MHPHHRISRSARGALRAPVSVGRFNYPAVPTLWPGRVKV